MICTAPLTPTPPQNHSGLRCPLRYRILHIGAILWNARGLSNDISVLYMAVRGATVEPLLLRRAEFALER